MRRVDSCPACDGSRHATIAVLDVSRRERFRAFSEIKYGGILERELGDVEPSIRRCADCGHCWYAQQPEPAQLDRMYASGRKLVPAATTNAAPTAGMRREMERLRAVLTAGSARPTLLDFGAGAGRWSLAAAAAGFEVVGFEPSAERRGAAAPHVEIVRSLDDLAGRTFDAIQLEQVLEHVTDPVTVLRSLRSFSHRATVVRLTVPNVLRCPEGASLWEVWPFDGRTPHTMAPYEHLHGFTPRSLDAVLGRANYRRVTSASYWRQYADNGVRQILGRAVAGLGSTLRIVAPG